MVAGLCGRRAAVSASRRYGRHGGEAGFGAGPAPARGRLRVIPKDSPGFGMLNGLTPACPQICNRLAPARRLGPTSRRIAIANSTGVQR